jgi:hypothetical protein
MPVITATVLSFAAEQFFGALISDTADDLYEKLKGDPVKEAYKKALGAAIKRYAAGNRVPLSKPWLAKDGLLSDSQVAAEIAKVLRFDQAPNLELIGNRWRNAIENPPRFTDFSSETSVFIEYLEGELRNSATFRPVFEAQDLSAIATDAQTSSQALQTIETQLDGLAAMLDSHLGRLYGEFSRASFSIQEQVCDFTFYMEEKTRGFVGRQWIFDEIDGFIESNPRGYFYIVGDPGIGKTALAAQLVKQRGYIHHFNIKAEGINKPATFLRNVCAQLIAAYDLNYTIVPPETTEDAAFFKKLLKEISDKLQSDKKCIILVDALDEVDTLGLHAGSNRLYLPLTLPNGIYIVVTVRPDERMLPRVECEQGRVTIDHVSTDNLADITDYLQASATREGIQNYIQTQNLQTQEFVSMMVEKSEGNFIYLRFVLPEISSGAYQDTKLEAIPAGLERYYEDHWQRMKGQDLDQWFAYKLPTIVGLTIAQEPISVDQIVFLIKLKRSQVREVLTDWQQFIHEEDSEFDGKQVTQYRLYHLSFFEFVAAKAEVADEHVDLKAMHAQFSDSMWAELFPDEQ